MLDKLTQHFPSLDLLSDESKRILSDGLVFSNAPAGTTMFSQGSECTGYALLLEGTVRVQKTSEDGREIVLYRVESGESCVMTTTCLISEEEYGAEGITETDIKVAIIPPQVFNNLLKNSETFTRFVFEVYAKRMSSLMMLVEEVVFKKLDKRLAQLLADKKTDTFETTHQDLATELGSVREVISRQLKTFERLGLIKLGRGTIDILNRSGLLQQAK